MKKGIIFDLDGTLWDSCEIVAESWNCFLRTCAPELPNVITAEDMGRVMGKTMKEIGDCLFANVPEDQRELLMKDCCQFEVDYMQDKGGKLYPGLEKTFEILSEKYHLFIVSNCQTGYIDTFLKWSGMGKYIEDIEEFGRTGKLKAYNIKLLAERNQLDQAVYVGDTQGDYNSTMEAGLPFILAGYGFGSVQADVPVINSLEELPELADKILK